MHFEVRWGYPPRFSTGTLECLQHETLRKKEKTKMKKFIVLITLILTALAVSGTAFSASPATEQIQKAEAAININTATAQELIALPGIGQKTADNIVSFRQEHGPYQTAEDLLKVKGVGKKTLKKIENLISFE